MGRVGTHCDISALACRVGVGVCICGSSRRLSGLARPLSTDGSSSSASLCCRTLRSRGASPRGLLGPSTPMDLLLWPPCAVVLYGPEAPPRGDCSGSLLLWIYFYGRLVL